MNLKYYTPNNVPKYKNIELVSTNDKGYQAYLHSLIATTRANRPEGYVPEQTSALHRASQIIEYIARRFYGSSKLRVLKYEVLYKGEYQIHYAELDIARIESDGSITIGEIKVSGTANPFKAVKQLRRSSEILSNMAQVYPIAITVDMKCTDTTNNLDTPKIVSHSDDFCFNSLCLSLGDIEKYATECNIDIDIDLFYEAHIEAINIFEHRTRKNIEKFERNLAKRVEKQHETISAFGMVLQKALCHQQTRSFSTT